MIQSHFKTFIATPKRDQGTLYNALAHAGEISKIAKKWLYHLPHYDQATPCLNLMQQKNSISSLDFKFMSKTYFDI